MTLDYRTGNHTLAQASFAYFRPHFITARKLSIVLGKNQHIYSTLSACTDVILCEITKLLYYRTFKDNRFPWVYAHLNKKPYIV